MGTSADEFDPPENVLRAFTEDILRPLLEDLARETGVSCRTKVAVWVRDREIPKFSYLAGRNREL
jgi:hypothetical protein